MAVLGYVDYIEEEWVSAHDAVQLVAAVKGGQHEAKAIIADGIRSMAVDVYADVVWETPESDVGGEWEPHQHPGRFYAEEAFIERDWWRMSEEWPADLAHWRWETNEFVLFLSQREEENPMTIFFRGIQLRRNDVLAVAGMSKRLGMGGRRPDLASWHAFWRVIVDMAADGELDSFKSQAEMTDEILERCGSPFSAKTVEPLVRQVWKAHVDGHR
jgi:hypothetical protein